MTKHFCDRCGKEARTQISIPHVSICPYEGGYRKMVICESCEAEALKFFEKV